MPIEQQFFVTFQVFLAALLSMVMGLDRERRQRPAGLRTHMLVGVGACMFTVLSVYAFPGSDTARVAAQVVTGVGFLGAGTIIQRKGDVKDLTTAASIWATAAVGMAVGAGAWFLALTSTLLIWTILAVIRRFADKDEGPNNSPGGRAI